MNKYSIEIFDQLNFNFFKLRFFQFVQKKPGSGSEFTKKHGFGFKNMDPKHWLQHVWPEVNRPTLRTRYQLNSNVQSIGKVEV
jgi:hypothetical protein